MKDCLRMISIIALIIAIPSLIIVDWFWKDYGILFMFMSITIGLVFDQIVRMKYPDKEVRPLSNYRVNKMINMAALVLFVQSPMALVYGNRIMGGSRVWLMVMMIGLGIFLNQLARIKFNYHIKNQDEK